MYRTITYNNIGKSFMFHYFLQIDPYLKWIHVSWSPFSLAENTIAYIYYSEVSKAEILSHNGFYLEVGSQNTPKQWKPGKKCFSTSLLWILYQQ